MRGEFWDVVFVDSSEYTEQADPFSSMSMWGMTIAEVQRPTVPAPDGRSRAEYAEALGVSGINPRSENHEYLHLWHVVHDLDELHRMLEHGIREWGQLHTRLNHGGEAITENPREMECARARAKAIGAACEAWRVGRGHPVDRTVLEDSGCVSEKFVDELAELAAKYGGDAAALMTTLEQNEVKYWRSENTDKLREYFSEQGYLTQEERLNRETIKTRILATVADKVLAGQIDTAWIDEVVASLPD